MILQAYDFLELSKKENYFESGTFTPGKKINVTSVPWGRLKITPEHLLHLLKTTKKVLYF